MSEKEPLKVVVQKAPAQIRNAEDLEFQELLDTVMGTIKPGIVKLQEQLTSMQGALSTLSPLDTNTVIAVVEQYIGTPIDTTEKAQIIAFIES
ncbi:MAG: hypothetical protein Q8O99_05145 [bacterium]|nr:hypothetical protein [bacterium]